MSFLACFLVSICFPAALVRGAPLQTTTADTSPAGNDLNGEGDLAEAAVELESVIFDGVKTVVVDHDYLVVIDGGSSHTDIYVYRWPTNKLNGTGNVEEMGKLVCQPILSNFERNPQDAGKNLDDCLAYAGKNVPSGKHNVTKVMLGATAGMRVLQARNPQAVKAIFQSVEAFIRANYAFIVHDEDFGILSPEREGGFAWVAINFVKGVFRDNALRATSERLPTWGSLDLGGASTQFSSEVPDSAQSTFSVRVNGHTYYVYTKSFLCYGKNEAFRRYKAWLIQGHNFTDPVVDPCRPRGYHTHVEYDVHFERPCSNHSAVTPYQREKYEVHGGGNGTACLETVQDLFRYSMDLQRPSSCPFQDSECAFSSDRRQKVKGKFLGTGALFYDTKNLRILSNESYSISPFDPAGFREARNSFCQKGKDEIDELIASKPELRRFFLRVCFDATYTEVLLTKVYELDDETLRHMVFAKNIDGLDVGWSLGWAVATATDNQLF